MPWNVWSLTENRWLMLISVASKKRAQLAIEGYLGEDHPASSMEPRRVRSAIEQHGTKLASLKPSMLWNLAMEDLARVQSNRLCERGYYARYHFHRSHVRKATSANDILRAALAEI